MSNVTTPSSHPDTGYRGNLVHGTSQVNAWLSSRPAEAALEPQLPIIDAHHHLWELRAFGNRYLFDDLLEDLSRGHNVEATVFLEASAMYRATGPERLKSIGEVEFARGMGAMSDSGLYGPCRIAAAIVAQVDLRLGDEAAEVLDIATEAAGGRLRGIRHQSPFDDGEIGSYIRHQMPQNLLADPTFIKGAAQVARRGLSFDTYLLHPQLDDVLSLARALPDLPIIVNHVGGVLGVGPHANRRDEVFVEWRKAMARLAKMPNVNVKLGGMGMPMFGFGFHTQAAPPDSTTLAAAWKPYIETCIELFGPRRCMFESNFPVDKQSFGYSEMWNAFKLVTRGMSASERADLFKGTAARVYRIEDRRADGTSP